MFVRIFNIRMYFDLFSVIVAKNKQVIRCFRDVYCRIFLLDTYIYKGNNNPTSPIIYNKNNKYKIQYIQKDCFSNSIVLYVLQILIHKCSYFHPLH